MVFSSVTFLFYFLPLVLIFYYCLPFRNILLLFASLIFYAWGEVYFVYLLLVSIGVNYVFGRLLDRDTEYPRRRLFLFLGLATNVCLIGVFKYANFVVDNLNGLLFWAGFSPVDLAPVHLPLGISFFTFQAMSYLVDVFRKTSPAEKNPLSLGLYISMFPQLVAGPIVRFNEIVDQLHERQTSVNGFASGVRRFIVGLGQKMLIANTVAVSADAIFAISPDHLTTGIAWLGAIAYTLQIYFDFAGYSNMAIGLGLMFGFRLPENFNYPYISQSVREFWTRWHMSLSAWFRDYLYIPLGGNRKGTGRTYFNLVIVFFLCGLWHGASWTFVFWGLFHGGFLVLERVGFGKWLQSFWAPVRHIYTLLVVVVGWVFFRSETFSYAMEFLRAMGGFAHGDGMVESIWQYLNREVLLVVIIGALGSAPLIPTLKRRIEALETGVWAKGNLKPGGIILGAEMVMFFGILILAAMSLAAQTHNPFIYFRF